MKVGLLFFPLAVAAPDLAMALFVGGLCVAVLSFLWRKLRGPYQIRVWLNSASLLRERGGIVEEMSAGSMLWKETSRGLLVREGPDRFVFSRSDLSDPEFSRLRNWMSENAQPLPPSIAPKVILAVLLTIVVLGAAHWVVWYLTP